MKNLAKLLAVALLAGVLGALGGVLVNHFMSDEEPQSPAPSATSQTSRAIPTPPATAGKGISEEAPSEAQGEKEEQEQTAQTAPPLAGDEKTDSEEAPASGQSDASQEAQPGKVEEGVQKEAGGKSSETEIKDSDQAAGTAPEGTAPPKAETATPEKAGEKTGKEAAEKRPAQPVEKDEPFPETLEKPKEQAATPPEDKEKKKTAKRDEPKSVPFDEMVEAEKKKEKALQVRSVTASAVDQNVVVRVALDRSAEPKMSRLVGRGQLRIILDFENAVRIKGKVPDVIKTPNPAVKAIRIGAHPDKLRIVLDLDPELTYSLNQHLFSRAYVLEIHPQPK